jgi:hypothetical protein
MVLLTGCKFQQRPPSQSARWGAPLCSTCMQSALKASQCTHSQRASGITLLTPPTPSNTSKSMQRVLFGALMQPTGIPGIITAQVEHSTDGTPYAKRASPPLMTQLGETECICLLAFNQATDTQYNTIKTNTHMRK